MRPKLGSVPLLFLGLLNGTLYSLLTPLWEGFDEPYHYGVVQQLSRGHRLPQFGRDGLSPEVARSLELVPAAPAVAANHGERLLTFSEWFALTNAERENRLEQLRSLDRSLAVGPEEGRNYESQQAPLAYLLFAPFDLALSGLALPQRIAILRLCAVAICLGILAWSTLRAARSVSLDDNRTAWILFCLFQAQMLYAASAHIANDGLAIALGSALIAGVAEYRRAPTARGAALTGLATALLLLTKAYGLAFLPALLWIFHRRMLAFAVPVVLAAGPWYIRNLLLYGTLSGAFTFSGAQTVPPSTMPWIDTFIRLARFFLFTGNNHFLSFNQLTISIGLLLFALGVAWSLWNRRDTISLDLVLLIASFKLAWVYSLYQAFLYAGGQAVPLSPWYGQILLASALLLIARGAPRWLLAMLAAFFTYLMAATWWLKLIPLYAGYTGARAMLPALARWYKDVDWSVLSQTALAPAPLLLTLAALSTLLAVTGYVLALRTKSPGSPKE